MPTDQPPGADELAGSKNVIMAVAQAIDAGDREAFLILLSNSSRADYAEDLDLTSADAKRLAGAMRNATFIGGSGRMLVYEFTVDGQKVTIYTIMEDGVWKLQGL